MKKSARKIYTRKKLLFGVGKNDADYAVTSRVNEKQVMCPYYRRWSNMLKRCYSPSYQQEQPTYIGCTVCKEWLTFSVFKKWMVQQNWQGNQLDKDLLMPGNHVYSPDMCVFVTHALNSLLGDRAAARGCYPQGVDWIYRNSMFCAHIGIDGRKVYLGYFDTVEAASNAYALAKVAHIRQIANEQTDVRITKGLHLHADLLEKRLMLE